MTATQRAARALRRIATGAFLAWFIAVSVLATQAAITISTAMGVGAHAARVVEAGAQAANDDGRGAPLAEPSPTEDDDADPMAPPGDDVPPEVEVDLEHDPWDVCSLTGIPGSSAVLIDFHATDDRATAVHPDAASPPPRA